MARKQMTNVEAITNLMEFSRYGALVQVFVIDALLKQAEAVANAKPEELATMDQGMGPSAAAWQGVAREVAAKLNQHLKGD